jgi:hypothetical protein
LKYPLELKKKNQFFITEFLSQFEVNAEMEISKKQWRSTGVFQKQNITKSMQVLIYYFLLLSYQVKLHKESAFSEKINNLDFGYKLMKSYLLLITLCLLDCAVCNATYLQLGLSSLT